MRRPLTETMDSNLTVSSTSPLFVYPETEDTDPEDGFFGWQPSNDLNISRTYLVANKPGSTLSCNYSSGKKDTS